MKKIIKLFIVMVVLCTTACTQILENRNDIDQIKTYGRLVMKVENKSRTIKPTFQESDIKTAVLTANNKEIKSWSGDNVINQIQNTDDILLDVGNYDFTMTFRNANGTDILTATTSQKIIAGNNSLVFDMKPVTTGNGDISITLTWDVASGINKITAGLYYIATNEPLEGFEDSVLEITTSNEQISTTLYSVSGVPVGQYIIKFKIYEGETYEKLLNTLSEVINVAAGIATSSQITLSKINTQYSIIYNTNGGEWAGNFIPTYNHNANEKIILPTAEQIIQDGYEFGGWYDDNNNRITEIPSDTTKNISVTAKWLQLYTITYNLNGGENNTNNPTSYTVETETITLGIPTKNSSTFLGWYNESGDKITEIKPSEPAENITVTARWSTTCTVSEAKNVILALSGEGPHDIVVTGEIIDVDIDIQSIKDGLINNPNVKVNLDLSGTTGWNSFSTYAFEGRDNLISIIIPDSVTSIGTYAFQNCSNLKSINIPNGVTSIMANTFYGCSSLTEIIIPDSVTSIAYNAFTDCNSVKTLVTGNGLTSFDYLPITSALESITIGDSITEIGDNSFKDFTNLKSVTIGSGVTSIGGYAFSGCSSLTSVTFAENSKLTTIGEFAFYQCTSLTNIDIPDSVTTIEQQAFNSCSSLESVEISENATQLLESTFYQCTSLKSVIIPDSVTTVGSSVFSGCTNLESVKIGAGMTEIGAFMFNRCGFTSIVIPAKITKIGAGAFGESKLETVYYTGSEGDWTDIDIDYTYDYDCLKTAQKEYNYTEE